MRDLISRTISHPALALGSTVLWRLLECIALQLSRWDNPRARTKRCAD